MDGNAVTYGLASAPGPDWLKEIIPTLGIKLKVHNALRSLFSEAQVSAGVHALKMNIKPNEPLIKCCV